MTESTDMIVPLLREMRLENLNEHENTRALLTVLDRRLGSDASAQKSFRQALSADSLMSKSATGEFEQRIEALEQKVRRLETHK